MFAPAPSPLQQRKLDIPGPVVTIKSELSALETHLGGLPPTKRLRHESTNEMWDDNYSQGSGTFFNSSSPQDDNDTGSIDDDDQFSPNPNKNGEKSIYFLLESPDLLFAVISYIVRIGYNLESSKNIKSSKSITFFGLR